MEPRIKILLVDDHTIVVDGLQKIINAEDDMAVIEVAYNGVEALEKLKQNEDINFIITDIKMPLMSGLELTRKIKNYNSTLKVLVLTMFDDNEFIQSIVDVGAEGYLLKNVQQNILLKAIRHIANDGTHYDNKILGILTKRDAPVVKETGEFTKRELEILKLVCQEFSSDEIANKLFISKGTVDTHRKNILKKANVKNSISLIRFAIEHDLISK